MPKNYISFIKETILATIVICFIFCGLYACASLGSPGGGDYDVTPPSYVSSTPELNAKNYNKNKIEIIFDELITLEKTSEKVIVTPPQQQNPIIKAQGRKIIVELKDSLWPNTTYTIDFTDAIVDNNEKNALEGFSFAFSTGETVDSLMVSGRLLNAENLEPMPNILIGLHTNLNDSAFLKLPFKRTTKTNDRGQFSIKNVSPGTYRIYALNDLNRDYKFDQPGEAIAFSDSLIIPGFEFAVRQDTIWKDTTKIEIDTINNIPYTRFLPDDVMLFLFNEKIGRQFMSRPERPEEHRFILNFNESPNPLPEIKLLNEPEMTIQNWYVREFSDGGKKIEYWITDSIISKIDTLVLETKYLKSDSLNQLISTIDTLKLFNRNSKKESTKKKKNEEEKIDFLGITISSSPEIYDTLKVTFSEPLLSFDKNNLKLEEKVDTIWKPTESSILVDSMNPRMYRVNKKWSYGMEYQVSIDSAAFMGIYGHWNNKQQSTFKIKKKDEYSQLVIIITGNNYPSGIGELLDTSDKVVRRVPLRKGYLLFPNLKPGKYYLRYIDDANGNGEWDTGNYAEKSQPEKVYYFGTFFDITLNWQQEQNWNIQEIPIEKQKPIEITKNKPQESKNKKNEEYNRSIRK